MADTNEPWSSRLLSLYPSATAPRPVLETAGERRVLVDRVVAALFDVLVCLFVVEAPLVFVVDTLSAGLFGESSVFLPLTLVALAPLVVTYSFALEWRYGRTPGKVWRGLVVSRPDGEPPSALDAGVRNLLRYVDYVGVPPLVVGVVSALVSEGGRRIGDRAAGTVVVRAV
jgi:uncharacterized RDD family membrane protein YckC